VLPAVVSALVSAGLVLVAAYGEPGDLGSEALVNLPLAVGFSTVAAGIWSTRPHSVGLGRLAVLYTTVGLGSACVLPAYGWASSSFVGADVAAWVSNWVWALGAAPLLGLGLVLYPDGLLPGRRWWPAAALGIGGTTTLVAAGAFRPGPLGNHPWLDNPLGFGSTAFWDAAGGVGFVGVIAAAVLGLVALVVKFRRVPAGDVVRNQICGFAIAGGLVVTAAVLPPDGGAGALMLTVAAGVALPLTVGVAVVRHRLLDQRASLDELNAQMGQLSESRRSIVTEREEERSRLRRDLHDGVGPSLAAIALGLRRLEQRSAGDSEEIRILGDEVQRAVAEIRRICDGLGPAALNELGLDTALRAALEPLQRFGPDIQVSIADLPRMAPAAEVATYRIVMEAATNAVRHSGAERVDVTLGYDNGVHLRVSDDGAGLGSRSTNGVGLGAMSERAEELGGWVSIGRGAEAGTVVRGWLPGGLS
jgi:signal transduction histidine kinase